MKPLIGITANFIKDDEPGLISHVGGAGQQWHALADDYITAIYDAGGMPVVLPVLPDAEAGQEWLDRLDGLLFSGGCDVSPLIYGQDTDASVGEIFDERDNQELALLRAALARPGFPILGICRGCQMLNVALGGTLVQDIDTTQYGNHFFGGQRMCTPTHTISTEDGSLIQQILNGEYRVNSYHHQGVKTPGKGVVVTARDRHGMIECIEVPGREGFTMATQWHPEGLAGCIEGHHNIFKAFVQAAQTK